MRCNVKWFCLVFALCASALAFPGFGQLPGPSIGDAAAADIDPLNGHRRLSDDEILVLYTGSSWLENRLYYPDENLDLGDATETSASDDRQTNSSIASASGRMHITINAEYFNAYPGDAGLVVESWDPKGDAHYGPVSWTDLVVKDGSYLDAATGDFDGDEKDELIIAYEDDDEHLNLVIVGGTDTGFELLAHYVDTSFALVGSPDKPVDFGLAAGDLDADETDEVLVVCGDGTTGYLTYSAAVRLYDVGSDFAVEFTDRSELSEYAINVNLESKDIAVGRFDTEPGDDVIAFVITTNDAYTAGQFTFVTLKVDDDLNLIQKTSASFTDASPTDILGSIGNRIATGDLNWDGTDEVVFTWSVLWLPASGGPRNIWVLDFATDLSIDRRGGTTVKNFGNQYADVAIGDFDSKQDFGGEIAVVWEGSSGNGEVEIFDVSSDLSTLTAKGHDGSWDLASDKRISVVADDFDGDGLFLGEPSHWQMESYTQLSTIIGEPPKHIDYIKNADYELEEVNVSRTWTPPNVPFSAEYEADIDKEVTTTNTSTSSFGYGVKVSVEESADLELPILGGVDTDLDATVGYEYDQHKEDMNKNYTSMTMGVGLNATDDDWVIGKSMDVNIWKYPVVGHTVEGMKLLFGLDLTSDMKGDLDNGSIPDELKDAFVSHGISLSNNKVVSTTDQGWQIKDLGSGKTYPLGEDVTPQDGESGKLIVNEMTGKEGPLYLQISHPGPYSEIKGNYPGRTIEWYQPPHENGNILSYPWKTDQISDLSDQIPELKKGILLTKLSSFQTGWVESTWSTTWTKGVNKENELHTKTKIEQDASISLATEIMDVKTKVTVKENFDQTWSKLTSTETSLSQSLGIKLSIPELSDAYSYKIIPFVYSTGVEEVKADGTTVVQPTGRLKVAYAVDPTYGNAANWWQGVTGYSDNPDPALNLPNRWKPIDDSTEWEWNAGAYNFQYMRGFFLLDAAGRHHSYALKDGEEVTLKVRVHNYSFKKTDNIEGVEVLFQYELSPDGRVWGMVRLDIDTQSIPTLWGFGNSQGIPNWSYATTSFDTTGLAGQYIRFCVKLDPDDLIDEVTGHDLGEKYSNNEGCFGQTIYIASEEALADTYASNLSAVWVDSGFPWMPKRLVREGETVWVSLNVTAEEEGGHAHHVFVSFYDGDPDKRGEAFDIELIPFIPAGESYELSVPFSTWGKRGRHDIFAVVHAKIDEADVTDNVISQRVIVRGRKGGKKGR